MLWYLIAIWWRTVWIICFVTNKKIGFGKDIILPIHVLIAILDQSSWTLVRMKQSSDNITTMIYCCHEANCDAISNTIKVQKWLRTSIQTNRKNIICPRYSRLYHVPYCLRIKYSYYEELTLDIIYYTYFEKKENYGESCCALQVKINPSKVDTFFFFHVTCILTLQNAVNYVTRGRHV